MYLLIISSTVHTRELHSFPTRRSSDLAGKPPDSARPKATRLCPAADRAPRAARNRARLPPFGEDRKSTRLNSSHVESSYAVFCLKKKKKIVYATTFCE